MELLIFALLTAAPPASKAESLAKAKQWEELYLAYAAVKPGDYGDEDKKKLAQVLAQGCKALEADDAVMGFSLAEKAVELSPNADGQWCLGKTGMRTDQRSAAEAALTTGYKQNPNDPRFPLELARLAVTENDGAGALRFLAQVPKKGPLAKEAAALELKAKQLQLESSQARNEAKSQQKELIRRQQLAGGGAPVEVAEAEPPPGMPGRGPPKANGMGSSYESGVDAEGRRTRGNQYFKFRYFNGQRDFGSRAEYEGRVQGALEESRTAARRILGVSRESPTDVILYSKEEFRMHHGSAYAQSVAGFYSESAIRMNDSAEINAENQATLVHEYVHAVVDELSSFNHNIPIWMNEGLAEYTEWRYQGLDGPPTLMRNALRADAQKGGLPTLEQMSRTALINTGSPAKAYAVSATAVGMLIKERGADSLLDLIRDVGKGARFEKAFEAEYGKDLAKFQEQLTAELSSR